MERVLVVFQATNAGTESLALAFGLGAVEGGANIRLRHLDTAAPVALEHQGYGPPRDADLEWAEGIGLAVETAEPAPELLLFLKQLERVGPKTVYVFGGASAAYAREVLAGLGFSLGNVDGVGLDAVKAAGKQMASAA